MKSTNKTNNTNTALCGLLSGLLLLAAGTQAHAGLLYGSGHPGSIEGYQTSPPADLGEFAVARTDGAGITVDGAGNVYGIYGNGGANQFVRKITPGGTESSFGTFSSGGRNAGYLALDSAGNLYGGFGNQRNVTTMQVVKWTPGGGAGSTFISGGALDPSGFDLMGGLAFDSSDNLYVGVIHNATNATFQIYDNGSSTFSIEKYSSTGTYLGQFASGNNWVGGLAFDSAGNLYAANYFTLGTASISQSASILKYAPGGSASTFASVSFPNNTALGGLAFDESGDLFAAVAGGGGSFIQKYSSTGTDLGAFAPATGDGKSFIAIIPEPTSAALLLGSGAMLLLRRRRAVV